MPMTANEVDELRRFVRSAMIRGKHHAHKTPAAVAVLTGCLMWKMDPGTDLRVRKNILWTEISGTRYALAYVQGAGGTVEMREGGQQGPVIARFTADTPMQEIFDTFESLKSDPDWDTFLAEEGA